MSSSFLDVVNVALEFHEKTRGRDLLDRLSSQAGVDVNVVRGRLTENEARYELRLSGLRKRLQKAFRLCAGPGVDCRVLSLRSGS